MRSIARQSVHLARSGGIIKQRPCSSVVPVQYIRQLHESSRSSSEPRGSSGHNDHHNSSEARQEEHGIRRDITTEKTAENSGLQAAADTSNIRRTLRQRRNAPDVPKPPPIPDWFLEHNVQLLPESVEPDHSAPNAETVICKDRATGQVLLEVPYYEAYADISDATANGRPAHRSDFNQPEKVLMEPKRGKDEEATTSEQANKRGQGFFTSKAVPEYADVKRVYKPTSLRTEPSQHLYNRAGYDTLLRWTLLEIESGVRAAFSLPGGAQPASSYAASNVDMSLLCPDSESHARIDQFVEDLATLTSADLIRLDANDFADLTSEYVGQDLDSAGSFSNLGYDVFGGYTSTNSSLDRPVEDIDDEMDEDEGIAPDNQRLSGINLGNPTSLEELRKALHENRHEIAKALGGVPIQGISIGTLPSDAPARIRQPQTSARLANPSHSHGQWDEARLRALLDSLLDAPALKRSRDPQGTKPQLQSRIRVFNPANPEDVDWPYPSRHSVRDKMRIHDKYRRWRSNPGYWLPSVAGLLVGHLERLGGTRPDPSGPLKFSKSNSSARYAPSSQKSRKLVHVRDLSDICRTPVGIAIVRRLIRVIQNRRRAGEDIVLIGTAGHDVQGPIANDQVEHDGLPLRSLVLPPFFSMPPEYSLAMRLSVPRSSPTRKGYHRILEINLRHIQSMLRRLRPSQPHDLFSKTSQPLLLLQGTRIISEQVLSVEHVHRIVLTAIGLSQLHAVSEDISPLHIGLATLITSRADDVVRLWSEAQAERAKSNKEDEKRDVPLSGAEKARARMDELKKIANPHETRLLSGVVNPENITTGFDGVHAPEETIDALKTLTSLSLLRPDAFKYGVLANDRLPGLMLYGPPGTGKTLLARAVAKEARATVLEISGAQIYEKYVGEGEKMVRAVFSLAKKLSPCIVFIDEADSIFGARSSAGNRNTHREIINQFLREWDGMYAHNVFIMIASNRPFDLDDAVLRRVPRRLLVDLPVAKDRESILGIHLKDERLDESISLATLAEQTPLYSGSDLKNLCVAAALACVREENKLLSQNKDDENFKLPEKRTLSSRHFEQAIREISASISEDMNSLTAIRKFDEQYGDRRGRRKKAEYGFGLGGQDGVDENAARVRQTTPPPP